MTMLEYPSRIQNDDINCVCSKKKRRLCGYTIISILLHNIHAIICMSWWFQLVATWNKHLKCNLFPAETSPNHHLTSHGHGRLQQRLSTWSSGDSTLVSFVCCANSIRKISGFWHGVKCKEVAFCDLWFLAGRFQGDQLKPWEFDTESVQILKPKWIKQWLKPWFWSHDSNNK